MANAADIKAILNAWQTAWLHQKIDGLLAMFAEDLVTSVSDNWNTGVFYH